MQAVDKKLVEFSELGRKGEDLSVEEVRKLMGLARHVFRQACRQAQVPETAIDALLTKFHDAGRRSPPTSAYSRILPGRPQSGADGNRAKRWRLDCEHKFFADEIPATLVEIKYVLQTLSMAGAPKFRRGTLQESFIWLTGHEVVPDSYRDPIQLVDISFEAFHRDRRLVQSGHIYPLDRGGRHEPQNAFLMLARSNQLQGNNTVPELLELMRDMIVRHEREPDYVDRISPEVHTRAERQAGRP